MSEMAWLENLLQQQNRVGETAGHVTAPDSVLTASRVTATAPGVTANPVTPKRRYKARSRRCESCQQSFTPKKNKSAIYCSDRCRQKGRRDKLAQQRKAEATSHEPPQELCPCLWCGLDFLADPTKHPKYHASCKQAAYRNRRNSAIETLATVRGWSMERAGEVVEREGMKKVSGYLKRQHYQYNEAGRTWVMAVEQGSVFVRTE